MRDEEFVSKTISDGSVDLEKFPASKVRQLATKLESSKATAHHIKQVAGDPQAAQINLLRHQCTELPAGKYKKKRAPMKPKQSNHKHQGNEGYHSQAQPKKRFDTKGVHNDKSRYSKCGDSVHIEGSSVQPRSTSVKLATSLVTSPVCVTRRSKLLPSIGSQKRINYRQAEDMHMEVPHMTTRMKTALQKNHFACR